MNKILKIGCLTLAILFFVGSAFFVGIGVGAVSSIAGESSTPALHKTTIAGSGEDQIAFLSLSGVIVPRPSGNPLAISEGVITPDSVGEALALALADDKIRGIVLSIDSPGGSPVASDEIYQHIKNTAAKKPVVVLMGDIAASGGYFIASAGSYLIANPATTTGSIGVIADIINYQELLNKLGVKQEVFKSGIYKDLFSSVRERTPEEKQMIQELLDTSYSLFVDRVAQGRHLDRSRVLELAQGKIYSGVKAKEVGLIDQLGYRNDAFEKAKELAEIKQATLVNISTRSFFDTIFSQLRSSNPLSALTSAIAPLSPGIQYLYR